MDGHGQVWTNTDRLVREYGISQDPQLVMPIPDTEDAQTPGRGIHRLASLRDGMNRRTVLMTNLRTDGLADRQTGGLADWLTGRPADWPTG